MLIRDEHLDDAAAAAIETILELARHFDPEMEVVKRVVSIDRPKGEEPRIVVRVRVQATIEQRLDLEMGMYETVRHTWPMVADYLVVECSARP